jgi:hypothetical protein
MNLVNNVSLILFIIYKIVESIQTTHSPTFSPTFIPTCDPTFEPTYDPTLAPTTKPLLWNADFEMEGFENTKPAYWNGKNSVVISCSNKKRKINCAHGGNFFVGLQAFSSFISQIFEINPLLKADISFLASSNIGNENGELSVSYGNELNQKMNIKKNVWKKFNVVIENKENLKSIQNLTFTNNCLKTNCMIFIDNVVANIKIIKNNGDSSNSNLFFSIYSILMFILFLIFFVYLYRLNYLSLMLNI